VIETATATIPVWVAVAAHGVVICAILAWGVLEEIAFWRRRQGRALANVTIRDPAKEKARRSSRRAR
jgi:hypothetical protein